MLAVVNWDIFMAITPPTCRYRERYAMSWSRPARPGYIAGADSGWVTVGIQDDDGVHKAIGLMRRGYERAVTP